MPLLDVSDVLSDPLFKTALTLIRATTTVVNGRTVRSETTSAFSGVVTSSRGDILARLADGRMRQGSITIHTQTRLVAGQGSTDADEVIHRGQRYTVTNVNDYSDYGAGFIAAEAELKSLS